MDRNIQTIALDLIKLDQENVRFGGDVAESQKEALQLLIDNPDDAKKLHKLAKDIAQYGMDPTELQLAFPDKKGNYIVIEGNRRLAAIKLLIKPDLCPIASMVKKFKKLKNEAKYYPPKSIQLSIVSTRKDGDRWIELKHTGENEGVGRVDWSSDVRDERKSRVTGVDSIGKQIRNLIVKNSTLFSDETKNHSRIVAITNLTRFFQSSAAQNYFYLKVKSKELLPNIPLEFIEPSLSYALSMMSRKDFTVKDIFHLDDQNKFIENIPQNLNPAVLLEKSQVNTNPSSSHTKSSDFNATQANSDDQHKKTFDNQENNEQDRNHSDAKAATTVANRVRARPDRATRIRLIDWSMDIELAKINQLFRELRYKLNVQDTPNSVAIVFRVLLETSCEYYIKKQHEAGTPVMSEGQPPKNLFEAERTSLSIKIQGVTTHLFKNKKLTRSEEKSIKRRASSKTLLGSIDHLNQFVHGYSAAAIPSELNSIADEYKPLLEKIWS